MRGRTTWGRDRKVKLTAINGAIHWKVNMLKKPAVYSRDTIFSSGMGGTVPHRKGFILLYHGRGGSGVGAGATPVAALVSVA